MQTEKKIIIAQSNYIPWKGYFNGIATADEFVVYDDMQYTKRDWRNRNKIKTPVGLKWLTIPVEVKGKYLQKINETVISNANWNKDHWKTLKHYYAKADCFFEVKDMIEEWYFKANFKYLTEINIHFIQAINDFLGISAKIRLSSEFKLHPEKTQRLVNICSDLSATDYYSGPAAKQYIKEKKFSQRGIQVHYFDFSNYSEYPQLYPPFEHGVSVLDLIFNVGARSKNYLKSSL